MRVGAAVCGSDGGIAGGADVGAVGGGVGFCGVFGAAVAKRTARLTSSSAVTPSPEFTPHEPKTDLMDASAWSAIPSRVSSRSSNATRAISGCLAFHALQKTSSSLDPGL